MTEKPYNLILGDALEAMKTLADGSVDAIVTDPPAGISFMSKVWDADKGGRDSWIVWLTEIMSEAKRVLKPGGHAFVWALPRTSHWTAFAVENAGFEIRDIVMHIFGSGFPKSQDVSKQLDKMHGAERKVIGKSSRYGGGIIGNGSSYEINPAIPMITAPATDEAKQWQGWGSALKPACENWILCRKPLEKGLTIAQNVLKWNTGALNIDKCRIGTNEKLETGRNGRKDFSTFSASALKIEEERKYQNLGRFPANLIHDGSDEVEAEFAKYSSQMKMHKAGNKNLSKCTITKEQVYSGGWKTQTINPDTYADDGTASRFFYCAKSSRADRNEGLEGFELMRGGSETFDPKTRDGIGENRMPMNQNHHPTVKPTNLMRYLCRLITPPNGIILDMFCGSGSTGKAAMLENFRFIGIDSDAEYIKIAEARIEHATQKEPLFAKAA